MSALIQNTAEWLENRKAHIGASDAPIIAGVSPWKTPYQLWQEKLDIIEKKEANFAQREGHRKEPLALEALEKETGLCLQPQVVFHPEIKWMMASLDAVDIGGKIIAEIKCPGIKDHEEALNGKVPEKYFPQLQHQMEVFKVSTMIYFSFHEGKGKILEVKRDERYIKNLINQEKEFFLCLQELKAPPMTDRDFLSVNSVERSKLALRWKEVTTLMNALEQEEKTLREALISTSKNQNSIGGGVRISRYLRKGSIDYGKIPQLKEVNLEVYRKSPIECWKITPEQETPQSR